jgi:hypothetical protein
MPCYDKASKAAMQVLGTGAKQVECDPNKLNKNRTSNYYDHKEHRASHCNKHK